MFCESRVVAESLDVSSDVVYEFARTMENLPKWASGLASGISHENGVWVAASPMGQVRVDMAPRNDLGVLDHDVTLPDGSTVHNALRVTPAGAGSTLSFVVLRQPGTTAAAFERDVAQVARDLAALKIVLERTHRNAIGPHRRD